MNNELVSIILTTLNAARFLEQSIDSCLHQTYQNIELIIVDGGSTDKTLEIVNSYNDPRINIIHQEGNVGKLPGAINLGLQHSNGKYLTWTQADSYYMPDAIGKMAYILDNQAEIGQVYADYMMLREDASQERFRVPVPEEILLSKSDQVGVCFLIRREVREKIGEHSLWAFPTHDYEYRLRIAKSFQSYRLEEVLYYWRYHKDSLTGRLPWPLVAKNDVKVRLRLGISNQQQACKDLAAIDIAYAFEQYQSNIFGRVPALVGAAMIKNPVYLLNKGVWSIFVKSISRRITVKI